MSQPSLPAPAPSPGRRRLRGLIRRPRRALVALLLLTLLGLGGWQAGRACLFEFRLRSARQAVERGHNLQAQYHLERCLAARPREPRAMLLAARVAWRV